MKTARAYVALKLSPKMPWRSVSAADPPAREDDGAGMLRSRERVEDEVLAEPRPEPDDRRLPRAPLLEARSGLEALDRGKGNALPLGEPQGAGRAEPFAVAGQEVHAAAGRVVDRRLVADV